MSLKRDVIASYLASGWSAVIGLAFVPLYVRYLGIESYGLVGFFATLSVWAALLDFGLAQTLNRELALYSAAARAIQTVRDLLRSVEWIYLATAGLLAALLVGSSAWIAAHWLNANSLEPGLVARSIALMGALIGVQWLGTLYRSSLLGLQRQLWLSATTACSATVRALGSIAVLAWIAPTITAFLLFQIAVSALESLALGLYLHRQLPLAPASPRFSASALKEVWRFAGGLAVISLMATLLTQVDKLILSRLLPLDQFGYFMLTITVAGAISVFVVPLHNIAYSRFSELVGAGDRNALADEYHKFTQLLVIGVGPVSIVLMFFAAEVVLLWTADAAVTAAVAPLLRVWALGTALNSLTHVPHLLQVAHGSTRLGIVINTITVCVIVPLLLFLVPRHGAIAAAWIWVAVNAAYLLVAVPVMHRNILGSEKWNWYLKDVLAPLIAGVIGASALKGLLHDRLPGWSTTAFLVFGSLLIVFSVGLATKLGRQVWKSVFRGVTLR